MRDLLSTSLVVDVEQLVERVCPDNNLLTKWPWTGIFTLRLPRLSLEVKIVVQS